MAISFTNRSLICAGSVVFFASVVMVDEADMMDVSEVAASERNREKAKSGKSEIGKK